MGCYSNSIIHFPIQSLSKQGHVCLLVECYLFLVHSSLLHTKVFSIEQGVPSMVQRHPRVNEATSGCFHRRTPTAFSYVFIRICASFFRYVFSYNDRRRSFWAYV